MSTNERKSTLSRNSIVSHSTFQEELYPEEWTVEQVVLWIESKGFEKWSIHFKGILVF